MSEQIDYSVRINHQAHTDGINALIKDLPNLRHASLRDFIGGAEKQALEELPKETLNLRDRTTGTVDDDGMGATLRTNEVDYAAAVHEHVGPYQHPTTPGTKPKFIEDPFWDWIRQWPRIVQTAFRKLRGRY